MERTRQPPQHLGPSSRAWFEKIVREFAFDGEHEWSLVEQAAGCVDRIEQARQAVERFGLLVLSAARAPKINPAAGVERDNKVLLARLLRELKLAGAESEQPRLPQIANRKSR